MIVTITLNPALDFAFQLQSELEPGVGKSIYYDRIRRYPGGGGINVARVMRTLLGPPQLGGSSGRGPIVRVIAFRGGHPGHIVRLILDADGINTDDMVETCAETRTNFLITTPRGINYSILGTGGEVAHEDEGNLRHKVEQLTGVQYAVISGSPPIERRASYYNSMIKLLKQKGATVILDTSKSKVLCEALSEKPDIIKPNLLEFNALLRETGRAPLLTAREERESRTRRGPEDALFKKYFLKTRNQIEIREQAFEDLLKKVREFHRSYDFLNPLLISLGEAGMLAATRASMMHAFLEPPLESAACKCTVAAGDTAIAAYVLGLATQRRHIAVGKLRQVGLKGKITSATILKFAVAASSATCKEPGSEICDPDEVGRLMSRACAKKYPS